MLKQITDHKQAPVIIGLLLPLAGLAVATLFPKQMIIEFAAILLSIIAAIYIGFSIADGRKTVQWTEIGVAIAFMLIALFGLWINPWFLVAGYISHGLWDWLHHADHVELEIATWYPPFCAVVDLVLGIGLIYWII